MKSLGLSLLTLILASCASGKFTYTKPIEHKIENTKEVNKSFNSSWSELLKKLADNGFTIDSASKDSGLIVASKKLTPPEMYADCGIIESSFKNMRGEFSSILAGAQSGRYVKKNGDIWVNTDKTTNLLSKINILLKGDAKKSSIQANVNFTLKSDYVSSYYVYPQGNRYEKSHNEVIWNTGETGVMQNASTICVSNSYLEKSIINLL